MYKAGRHSSSIAFSLPQASSAFSADCASVFENLWRIQVELGGGIFRGVQPGVASLGLEPLILIDDPVSPYQRSTLAIKASELTADKVRTQLRKKREEFECFEQFTENAAERVFSRFARTEAA